MKRLMIGTFIVAVCMGIAGILIVGWMLEKSREETQRMKEDVKELLEKEQKERRSVENMIMVKMRERNDLQTRHYDKSLRRIDALERRIEKMTGDGTDKKSASKHTC